METLNGLSIVISIIVGIFGIGGYIFAIVGYFRNKAASSQRKQTTQLQSSQKQYSYQPVSKSLSKLDWMEILWNGIEDFGGAYIQRDGFGCGTTIITAIIGTFILAFISSFSNLTVFYISLSLFVILFITTHLLFYVYFVGRRIEQKVEDINHPLTKRSNHIPNY